MDIKAIIESITNITNAHLEERFEIKKVLGKGANGKVYLAYDNKLKKDVALKIVDIGWFKKHEKMLNDIKDFSINKKLNNRHLIKYYDIFRINTEKIIITMEVVSGWNIDKAFLFKKIYLTGIPFWTVTVQLLDVVNYLHKHNIKHNDIHGGNIMLTSTGFLYLIDYGWMCQTGVKDLTACRTIKSPTGKEDIPSVVAILKALWCGDSILGYSKVAKLNGYIRGEVNFGEKLIVGDNTPVDNEFTRIFLSKLENGEYDLEKALKISKKYIKRLIDG